MKAFDNRLNDKQIQALRSIIDMNLTVACSWTGHGHDDKKQYKFFCAHMNGEAKYVVAYVTEKVCLVLGCRFSPRGFLYTSLSMLEVQSALNVRLNYYWQMAHGYESVLNRFAEVRWGQPELLDRKFEITTM